MKCFHNTSCMYTKWNSILWNTVSTKCIALYKNVSMISLVNNDLF